ncbi:hypothetical protein M404DRAFT_1009368 [Pisolithus tinctorius Marx 270]|uniref:Uncharacterized protein n=1 Tax=Pisolithus tinctorius Marx 270 TaxID=870435 RepID=A0A0C3J514_PISTI|nr:hypothetical protein M404DRAFT_1009368 [Pisolithus tinctorius Marx 270]
MAGPGSIHSQLLQVTLQVSSRDGCVSLASSRFPTHKGCPVTTRKFEFRSSSAFPVIMKNYVL